MTPLSPDFSYGSSALSVNGMFDPPSPVESLVERRRVLVAPSFRALIKARASKFLWKRTMIGPTLSPDKAGGWKLPIKVANARRQRAANKARASPHWPGRRRQIVRAASSDDMPALTSASDDESSDSDSDDDSDSDSDDDEERKDNLGATITAAKLQTIRKKVGPHATFVSKTQKWHCTTCKNPNVKCRFARGIYIRSNKVTARFAEHSKKKVHLEASDREASRLAAVSGSYATSHPPPPPPPPP